MRTLNEQIQRLRDVLVDCYNTIKRKGGTIPEAGERNMTNLPAAVHSIPQIHDVLTELEVTANGEYLPADYDADGFSKVTAEFDASSLPKVKVSTFAVNDSCVGEDGKWIGIGIDTSSVTSFNELFYMLPSLKFVDFSNLSIENATNFSNMFSGCGNLTTILLPKLTSKATNISSMFRGSTSLQRLDTYGWDTSNVTDMSEMFYNTGIKYIDATSWDVSKCASALGTVFEYSWGLESVVGDRNYKEVADNNIAAFIGARSRVIKQFHKSINTASIRAIINGFADVTDLPAESRPILQLDATLLAKLTEEDIAIATNKGWSIS